MDVGALFLYFFFSFGGGGSRDAWRLVTGVLKYILFTCMGARVCACVRACKNETDLIVLAALLMLEPLLQQLFGHNGRFSDALLLFSDSFRRESALSWLVPHEQHQLL